MKKVAIVIGHNKFTGATAWDGTDEWIWNHEVAKKLKKELQKRGIDSQIFIRNRTLGYTSAMKVHAHNIKEYGADLALELHFNSAGKTATGFEHLYFWRSWKSRRWASIFARHAIKSEVDVPPRRSWISTRKGYKSLFLRSWNKAKADQRRGAEFTYYTHCPAVILEPCFASNPDEWEKCKFSINEIVDYYASAIEEGFKS